MTRTYGTIEMTPAGWRIEAEPQVMSKLRRIIRRAAWDSECVYLSDTPENCRDIEWFCLRYPMVLDGADPVMVDVLGLKRQQSEGIRDPDRPLIQKLQPDPKHLERLARKYLRNVTHHNQESP